MLRPYGLLIYDFKPLAIRFIHKEGEVSRFYDVAIDVYSEDDVRDFIKGLKKIPLIDNGNMFVTREELKKGIIIEDKTDDYNFVKETLRVLKYLSRSDNDLKMTKKFLVEVKVKMHHVKKGVVIRSYRNTVFGKDEQEAKEQALKIIKEDLGVDDSRIVDVSIVEKQKLSIK